MICIYVYIYIYSNYIYVYLYILYYTDVKIGSVLTLAQGSTQGDGSLFCGHLGRSAGTLRRGLSAGLMATGKTHGWPVC